MTRVIGRLVACRWCGLVLGSGVGRTEKKFMSICIFPQLKEVFIQQSVQGVTSTASVRRSPQQARVCTFPPGHEAPPFWGAGLLHSLLLSWVPALQADQELQQLQRPSALAPAQIISQGRRKLASKKQLGSPTHCPGVVSNLSLGRCLVQPAQTSVFATLHLI